MFLCTVIERMIIPSVIGGRIGSARERAPRLLTCTKDVGAASMPLVLRRTNSSLRTAQCTPQLALSWGEFSNTFNVPHRIKSASIGVPGECQG
jgi:hypothetical protein